MRSTLEHNEEIIIVKSFTIHFFMYFFLFWIVVGVSASNLRNAEDFFMITNGSIVIFLGLILLAYGTQFLITFIFYDLDFYKRAVISGTLNTVLIFSLIFLLDPTIEIWLATFFSGCYALFFELPRIGIITHYDNNKPDLEFIKWSVHNYPKLLLIILGASLILLFLNFPDISLGKVAIVTITNLSIVAFLSIIAWRLKAKYHLKRILTILKIYLTAFAIIAFYAIAFNLLARI